MKQIIALSVEDITSTVASFRGQGVEAMEVFTVQKPKRKVRCYYQDSKGDGTGELLTLQLENEEGIKEYLYVPTSRRDIKEMLQITQTFIRDGEVPGWFIELSKENAQAGQALVESAETLKPLNRKGSEVAYIKEKALTKKKGPKFSIVKIAAKTATMKHENTKSYG